MPAVPITKAASEVGAKMVPVRSQTDVSREDCCSAMGGQGSPLPKIRGFCYT